LKKILCIDYFFPPLMTGWWIGLGVIKFLPEFGWQPIVISAADRSLASPFQQLIQQHLAPDESFDATIFQQWHLLGIAQVGVGLGNLTEPSTFG